MRAALLAAAALAILLAGRALDEPVSRLFYDPELRAFPWRHAWALETLGHEALKWIMVGFWAACLVPKGLRRGALLMAIAAVAVTLLKQHSPYACPWDLPDWGGSAAASAAGRCLPAGHPVSGFMLFGLYFALRPQHAVAARAALIAAWLIGLTAGAVQILRGAHFVSHVLWTAWIAWSVTLAADWLTRRRA